MITIKYFYADWCNPCKTLSPIIDSLKDQYQIIKLNVEDNEEQTEIYNIISVPTILIFEDEILKERLVGSISKDKLKDKLK